MKSIQKSLFLAVLCLMTVVSAGAKNWYIGPQASLNLTKLSNTDFLKGKAKVAYALGAFGGYDFGKSKIFGLEGQVMVASQQMEHTEQLGGKTGTVKSTYINIPILAKVTLLKKIYLQAGPQFGFNLGSMGKMEGSSVWESLSNVSDFDCSMYLGAGIQFGIGLRIGISYDMSFTDFYTGVTTTPASVFTPSLSNKNRVFSVNVGWRF